jgi:hypothetical protein
MRFDGGQPGEGHGTNGVGAQTAEATLQVTLGVGVQTAMKFEQAGVGGGGGKGCAAPRSGGGQMKQRVAGVGWLMH